MEIKIEKMLRLENSMNTMNGESVNIFGVEFTEKVMPPKVFVFEALNEISVGNHNEIRFSFQGLSYVLLNARVMRRSESLYVVECKYFNFTTNNIVNINS